MAARALRSQRDHRYHHDELCRAAVPDMGHPRAATGSARNFSALLRHRRGDDVADFLAAGSRLHAGLFLAALAAVLIQILVSRTAFGFRLAVLGENPGAASYAGIDTSRTVVMAMALSGGFAGLAGAVEIAGVYQKLQDNFAAGFGLEAIAVALMARLQPWAIPFTAVLFGVFYVGTGAVAAANVSAVSARLDHRGSCDLRVSGVQRGGARPRRPNLRRDDGHASTHGNACGRHPPGHVDRYRGARRDAGQRSAC